jgi:hypothetical protein
MSNVGAMHGWLCVMDCNRNAGGREELPPLEGPQSSFRF